MWFFKALEWLDGVTDGNGVLAMAAIIGAYLLVIGVLVACLCGNFDAYIVTAALVVGGAEWAIYATESATQATAFFRAAVWSSVGALGLLTLSIVSALRRREQRKRQLILSAKKSAKLLPEHGNSYVRARLHTALNVDGAEQERKSVPYENRGAVRLGYAKRLLAGLQDAALSPAERLETQSLVRAFAEYTACEKWDAEQLRAVNELFSRLLKLAAKYGVEG